MKCKNCGREYYNAECPTCKDNKNLANTILNRKATKPTKPKTMRDAVIGEERSSILRIVIPVVVIIILLFTGPSLYMTYQKVRGADAVVEANLALQKLNDRLTTDNTKLRNENNKLKKERIEIMRRGDNTYRKYKNAISKNNVTRSIPITQTINKTIVKQKLNEDNFYKSYNNVIPKKKETKVSTKKYKKFSTQIKLVSDSRITYRSDGRLYSNMPIYGEYDSSALWLTSPTCPKKPLRLYKTITECYVKTLGGDKLYFSSGKKKRFDDYKGKNNNERIDCDYSKTHGIMHSCSIESIKNNSNRKQ